MNPLTIGNWFRANAKSIHYTAGSCRMGTDDTAVTDARLRVGRIARLRIGDASVVRPPTSNNTQAVTAMLGPYAADLVIPALEPTTHKEAA